MQGVSQRGLKLYRHRSSRAARLHTGEYVGQAVVSVLESASPFHRLRRGAALGGTAFDGEIGKWFAPWLCLDRAPGGLHPAHQITPVASSSASLRKTPSDARLHSRTFAQGSTRYGPHIAPAASDVRLGISSATSRAENPASNSATPVVSPETPAPTTTTVTTLSSRPSSLLSPDAHRLPRWRYR